MPDIALTLDFLVPAADYIGSLTANNKASYDVLDWRDARAKPSWADIVAGDAAALAVYEAGRPKSEGEELEAMLRASGVLSAADVAALAAKREGKR